MSTTSLRTLPFRERREADFDMERRKFAKLALLGALAFLLLAG